MKQLKTLGREELGFVEKGRMGVNIQLIWEQSQGEEEFAQEFSDTLAHELLHVELAKALGKGINAIPVTEEEETIRAMVGEEWDEEIEQSYAE